MNCKENRKRICRYVMCNLKRPNAKFPAYKQLKNEQIEVFTPMVWRLKFKNGEWVREQVPFIRDLFFVYDTREIIDPIVKKPPTLQYRYQKGGGYCNPMMVNDAEMERFCHIGSTCVLLLLQSVRDCRMRTKNIYG